MKTLIRNVLLCDGTGVPLRNHDLIFECSRILETGKNLNAAGCTVIDGDGLILAPGFIDAHAHSDLSILAFPDSPGKIAQGVTTEISGNCGLSAFPVDTDEVKSHLEQLYRNCHVPVTWSDFSSFADRVDEACPAVNQVFLCGHNTLRACVSGYENHPLSAQDIQRMRDRLFRMLQQGAGGFSTGLLYNPGCFSTQEELETTASALRGTGKVYATHLRSEGKKLLESLQEAFQIARAADGKLQVSHLKTAGKENWHKLPGVLELLRKASEDGLQVHADRYPYTRAMTSLSVILPPPYDTMPDQAIQETLLSHPEKQRLLEKALAEKKCPWNDILLCSTGDTRFSSERGKDIQSVAEKYGMTPEKLCTMLMSGHAADTMAAFHGLSEENLKTILRQDFLCCGTDETSRPADGALGWSHPRCYGSFPEFFQIVSKEYGIPEAVRRMTSLPARIFRMEKRGVLAPGNIADMVLFDPDCYRSTADFANPHSLAEGVRCVWVGGVLSWNEKHIIRRAGRCLRIRNQGEKL